MPRAGDAFLQAELPRSHDPLVRINSNPADLQFDFSIEALLEMWREWMVVIGLPLLEEFTGIDFTFLEPLLGGVSSPEDFITNILNPTNLLASIPAIVEAITGVLGGDLPFLGSFFGDLLGLFGSPAGLGSGDQEAILGSLGSSIPIFGPFIEAITGLFGGDLGDLTSWANNIPIFGDVLDLLFSGIIPASNVGIGSITNEQPNLLAAPGFGDASSLNGQAGWSWDGTDGRTDPGCASVVADGTLKGLLSHKVGVQADQTVHVGVYLKWSGVSASGAALRLQVREYTGETGNTQGDDVTIGTVSSPAASSAWGVSHLQGDYTPGAGVTAIKLRFVVLPAVTAGTIKWDDAEVKKTGLLEQGWVSGLPEELQSLFGFAQSIIDRIFEAITGFARVDNLLDDLFGALQNIPFLNIAGAAGPANIGGSIFGILDNLIGGFVGTIGTGATLPDLFNVGQEVSGNAFLGKSAFDVTAIRNAEGMSSGMLATSTSSLSLDQVGSGASARTFALTQSTAITLWERVQKSAPIGVIRWYGSGTTNINDFCVNIWKMDPSTGIKTCQHASADIVTNISGAIGVANKYVVPVELIREPGEIWGYELAVRGIGTHSVAGETSWLGDDPDMYPRRKSSVRDSGASSPTVGQVINTSTYSTNVPFIEVAITDTEVSIPHTPQSLPFTVATTSTLVIPSWPDTIEPVGVGGGGGGHVGGTWGISGKGGAAGAWGTATWEKGVHFAAGDTITITVGAGGSANGGDGGNTVISVNGYTVTCTGGQGADDYSVGGDDKNGRSPGNINYGDIPYVGGLEQSSFGGAGSSPGGGGAGGNYVSFQPGGKGATGQGWLRLKQVALSAEESGGIFPDATISGASIGTPTLGFPIYPVAFDAIAATPFDGTTTATTTFTGPTATAGSDVFVTFITDEPPSVSAMVYDPAGANITMTLVSGQYGEFSHPRMEVWRADNVPAGAKTINISVGSTGNHMYATAVAYTNVVSVTTQLRSNVNNATASIALTGVDANELAFGSFMSNATHTSGSGGTQRLSAFSTPCAHGLMIREASSSITLSATASGGFYSSGIAVIMSPV